MTYDLSGKFLNECAWDSYPLKLVHMQCWFLGLNNFANEQSRLQNVTIDLNVTLKCCNISD